MTAPYELHRLRVVSGRLVNYCYVIVDRATRQACVVDPAWDHAAVTGKLDELQADLTVILLTHSHTDHVQLVPRLTREYAPAVWMSRLEIEGYGFQCNGLQAFEDGQVIRLGATTITCLVTPGHSFGSSCFLLSGDLMTGDTIFIEGCGVCAAHGSDAGAMFESVQRIKSLVHPQIRVHPGHAFGELPGQPMHYLHMYNMYFQFQTKEEFIAYRMRKNQNLSNLQYV
ncbi:MBL fold metallo-hydrolase [Paenibacillus puerhi]|uniref:MBL fold metallo-hydrolase n=1 Tax=Paenibacillus puerhi TaxID=2692622 RepID=UPI001356B3CB|nr:MBL fold metallo-hydrolase [Paenibacillus puerhi]